MKMIGHPTKPMHSITKPPHPLLHQKIKMISILVINKDILPAVPP